MTQGDALAQEVLALSALELKLAQVQAIATTPLTRTGKFAHVADLAGDCLDLVAALKHERGLVHRPHWVARPPAGGYRCDGSAP